jgi:hypothetical protein
MVGAGPDTGGERPEPRREPQQAPPAAAPDVEARMLLDLDLLQDLDLLRELESLRRLDLLEAPPAPTGSPEKKSP